VFACVIPPHGMCVSSFLPHLDAGQGTIGYDTIQSCLYLTYLVSVGRSEDEGFHVMWDRACVHSALAQNNKMVRRSPTRKEGVPSHGRCSWPLGRANPTQTQKRRRHSPHACIALHLNPRESLHLCVPLMKQGKERFANII
jgi:hypothetical protein